MKKYICFVPMVFLVSCASMMPDVTKIVDDMTDTAVRVDLSKEVTELKDTDVLVTVQLISKDPVVAK